MLSWNTGDGIVHLGRSPDGNFERANRDLPVGIWKGVTQARWGSLGKERESILRKCWSCPESLKICKCSEQLEMHEHGFVCYYSPLESEVKSCTL